MLRLQEKTIALQILENSSQELDHFKKVFYIHM